MTSHGGEDFPYYRSPDSIRKESFRRRVRGLDESEVYEYLDLLADQVQATEKERAELKAANERLRTEFARAQSDYTRLQTELQEAKARLAEQESLGDRVNEQVVQLFSQAQLVAEEMVEDVSRDARQRLTQARAQERQILDEAVASAGIEVRTFARSAQQQMQSIMETFAHQVEALGDKPQDREPGFPMYDPEGWRIETGRSPERDPRGS